MSTFPVTDEQRDHYYFTLGKFIHTFARAEGSLTETIASVNATLAHFGEIGELRNKIAHSPASPNEGSGAGEWWVSTWFNAKEEKDYELLYFTPAHLLDAVHDLEIIPDRLLYTISPEFKHPNHTAHYQKLLTEPWQYSKTSLRGEGPKHANQAKK